MNIIELAQGSESWHKHRASHFNASDAPAMLGISKHKSRNQLLRELATGITPEIDAATQRRFDDGHNFEALARPLAEEIIGQELFPVVGSEGKLSASFDGLTMDESICFEHKTLNAKLATELSTGHIAEQYRAQMEQQLLVSGAERCLFMASSWSGDECTGEMHTWYESDQEMRDRLLQGWTQFASDLENYVHVEPIEKPKAETIQALPAVFVQATGMVTASNLTEFKEAAQNFIANIKTELATDDDFANAEATVKFCKSAEDDLEGTKKAILAQTSTIADAISTLDHIQAQLRDKRLVLNKLVSSEKEARKLAIVSKAVSDFTEYVDSLETETKPVRLTVQRPDFGGAIKGMKKLAAMQEAVDTALRNGKFEVDQVAKDVRAKLAWCKNNAAGMSFLFHDLTQIITKPMDDFTLTITSRIKEHKEAEARKEAEIIAKAEAEATAKLEAQRAAIQAEEERKATAKAQAEAEAILAAERAKQAEEEARAQTAKVSAITQPSKEVQAPTGGQPQEVAVIATKRFRPTRMEMVMSVANSWDVSKSEAEIWLCDEFASLKDAA